MKYRLLALLLICFVLVHCRKEDQFDDEFPAITVPGDPIPDPQNQPIPVITATSIPCDNGFAGEYPCSNYTLLNRVALSVFDSSDANDNWGWKDPETNKEYVLQGLDDGVGFLDISNPAAVR